MSSDSNSDERFGENSYEVWKILDNLEEIEEFLWKISKKFSIFRSNFLA